MIKRFKPGRKMTLFVVCFLPLLIFLGNWQLDRGAFKRSLEEQYLSRLTVLPVNLDQPTPLSRLGQPLEPFTRVRVSGKFTNETFLLDNQISNGKTGYWVYQVFQTASSARFLVNRGFLAAPPNRESLPGVPKAEGAITVVATLWPDLGLPPIFASEPWGKKWPKRIQRRNIQRMADASKSQAYELRLESGQPGVLAAAPFAQKLSDLKHRGYALTWFGLALALFISYLVFGTYRAKHGD